MPEPVARPAMRHPEEALTMPYPCITIGGIQRKGTLEISSTTRGRTIVSLVIRQTPESTDGAGMIEVVEDDLRHALAALPVLAGEVTIEPAKME
jgi:hypothetical protein